MATEQELYRGHQIELRGRAGASTDEALTKRGEAAEEELLIDGKPVAYGRLPEGQYFLRDYAYDWHDDLVDLARRYVDYILRAADAEKK